MEVTSIDNFSLDGVSCSTVGLWCDTPPIQVLADEKGASYAIGSDEELYINDDNFKDIQFRFTAYAFFADDFDQSDVYAFLHGKSKLTMSRNTGYYWKIRSISCSPSHSQDGKKIKYQITIRCAPFRYVDNEQTVTLTETGMVENAGTRYCKPIYTLSLSDSSGSGTLTVNGQSVSISIPQSIGSTTFVIDAEKMLAYSIGTGNVKTIRTNLTSGIDPFLGVGNNYVQFSGIIPSVDIQRNERCY